ncbi:EAL domain-containing protein [Nitrospira tepida]|uniref:EAL domain-containing protein n=1 Tax=Nitrospira tepida TaxID=2973512 RepID=A0AA86T2U5_9BACT|nr:EAL domain-containing protein [Nitrospira tepida]
MTGAPPVKRPLVLVVDDEPGIQSLIGETLSQAGFEVEAVSTGQEAVTRFPLLKPDLVLMDVLLPGMNGFAACSLLRRLPQAAHVPIVFMTSFEDTESVERAYEAGATDFMSKPFNPLILGHRVRYLLRAGAALRELSRSKEHLAHAQHLAQVGSWEWDLAKRQLRVSERAAIILGLSIREFSGSLDEFLSLAPAAVGGLFKSVLEGSFVPHHPSRQDHTLTMPDGEQRTVSLQARALPAEDGRTVVSLTGTVQDITERRRIEEHIHHLAYYDSLTGLPNRLLFRDRAQQALAAAKRHEAMLGILFLDIDRFKFINDSLGHSAGDALLKQVAERIMEAIRASDSVVRPGTSETAGAVARLGGDEFTILLPDLRQPDHASGIARRILSAIANPFLVEGREVFITGSIGISLHPSDGENLEELLKNADTAMYQAKNEGRNNYQFYSRSMNEMAADRLALENDLRRAIERHELRLHYQPLVDIHTGLVIGVEALLRWAHPTRGLLPPGRFVDLVEEIGLGQAVGEWVLETACRETAPWQSADGRPLIVAVNVSNAQFSDRGLVTRLSRLLRETGFASSRLELELTETIMMPQPEEAAAVLQQLKGMGLRLALDDFGTGYSSIGHLRTLPFDTVKIDRSFITEVATNATDATIAEAMITMAHARDLRVLAEGIETVPQLSLLRQLGCDEVQGYLFSPPVPADSIPPLLTGPIVPRG